MLVAFSVVSWRFLRGRGRRRSAWRTWITWKLTPMSTAIVIIMAQQAPPASWGGGADSGGGVRITFREGRAGDESLDQRRSFGWDDEAYHHQRSLGILIQRTSSPPSSSSLTHIELSH